MNEFGCSMGEAQRIIDRGRLKVDGDYLHVKSVLIEGSIEVLEFVPKPKGLKPIFETDDFAVFDKPSGVLVHPKSREDDYTLNDEIRFLFGKDANVVHRIDKETSGLVIVSKNKKVEVELKNIFQQRDIKKEYLALVRGKIEKPLEIDKSLKVGDKNSVIKIKVFITDNGKSAKTAIIPIKYFDDKDMTLVKAIPFTGRQHQIRVHLFHVKHPIIGDALYGLSEEDGDRYLGKNMSMDERIIKTGASRLMLHANFLEFEFREKRYKIESNIDFERIIDEECIV